MPSPERSKALVTGAVCGVVSGLLGVGGAVIMVPLLVGYVGLTQHRAHGTSLVVTVATASFAVAGYATSGHVHWILVATLAAGSFFGAPLGARWAQSISATALQRAFGVLMMLVGIRLLLVFLPQQQWLATEGWTGSLTHVGMGFAVGVLSGFFGVGGGVVLVPALVLLSGLPQHLAQGVSLGFIIPTAIVGGLTHYRLGNVDTRIVFPLAAAASLAAFAASFAASAIPGTTLRLLFGCVLIAVGVRQVLRPKGSGKPGPAATAGRPPRS